VNFLAIDLLHDPQTLAERLHGRIAKGGEPFLYRLLILHLIARIVGRNQLQLLNLYPYLMKYLQPTQKDVTKVMACFVEACHAQVPPSELRPSIVHIIQTFITEAQAPEVIEVGLNTIREVCVRSVNILEEVELTDLTEFRKFKHKGVAMAARSLINAYRELHPALLIRALRGKEAIMAMTRGELQAPVYGAGNVSEQIDGLELLAERRNDGEEGNSAKQMMQDQVLSTEDLQKLRKLKLQKSIELQLGRKRKAEEMSMSGSDSDSDKGDEDSGDERGLSGRLPDMMSAEMLRGRAAKPRSKEARVAAARSDFDIKAQIKEKAANRKGGKTNKENARSKPMLMVMAGKKAQRKTNKKASEKMANLKGHIKTLKQKCKTKRRRC
jgi:protein SDA1